MKGGINMPSILPTDIDDNLVVPVEIFINGICDVIEKKTGKRPSIEELEMLHSKEIGQLAKLDRMKVTIIPGLLSKIVCLGWAAYNRAVVNGSLMKKNYFN